MVAELKKVMEVAFDKKKKPSMFLANLFKKKQLDGIKVEVQSRTIKSIYSVDVQLGTGGRYIDMSKYKKTDYVVPEYNDLSPITEQDMLEAGLGETEYDNAKVAKAADLITDRQEIISDMQRRAEEKQAADALFNGEVVLSNGDKITFNKKGSHNINLNSRKFSSDANGTPVDDIAAACGLIVTDAKLGDSVFNFISNDAVVRALLGNAQFRANADIQKGIDRTNVGMPEELTPGAKFHGQFACGGYRVNIWSYDGTYEIPTGYGFANEGTEVTYIPSGKAVILPLEPNFKRYYGALNSVDASVGSNVAGAKISLKQAEQLPYAYDEVNNGSAVTKAGVKSRPLCVPNDVDAFVTLYNLI